MAFVKVSKAQRQKMFCEGGYRERDIMKKSTCVTNSAGYKGCVTFHDTANGRKATYRYGRGWAN